MSSLLRAFNDDSGMRKTTHSVAGLDSVVLELVLILPAFGTGLMGRAPEADCIIVLGVISKCVGRGGFWSLADASLVFVVCNGVGVTGLGGNAGGSACAELGWLGANFSFDWVVAKWLPLLEVTRLLPDDLRRLARDPLFVGLQGDRVGRSSSEELLVLVESFEALVLLCLLREELRERNNLDFESLRDKRLFESLRIRLFFDSLRTRALPRDADF